MRSSIVSRRSKFCKSLTSEERPRCEPGAAASPDASRESGPLCVHSHFISFFIADFRCVFKQEGGALTTATRGAMLDGTSCDHTLATQDACLASLSVLDTQIWQESRICGVLRNPGLFGVGWWYRIQLVDKVLAIDTFERSQVFGKPLFTYAIACSVLPSGYYHVAWRPQWVPSESIAPELMMRFWQSMPSRFLYLTMSLGDDMVWREDKEHYTNFSGDTSEHLCLNPSCDLCRGASKVNTCD